MMNEDLHEALPLWSLDRRGDGPRGTATTRGVVGVSSPLFVRPVPLGDPLGMIRYAPSRRAPERATTDHIRAAHDDSPDSRGHAAAARPRPFASATLGARQPPAHGRRPGARGR